MTNKETGKVYTQKELLDEFGIDRMAIRHMQQGGFITLDEFCNISEALLSEKPVDKERLVSLMRIFNVLQDCRKKAYGGKSVFLDSITMVWEKWLAEANLNIRG